jgi:hypothetical protein
MEGRIVYQATLRLDGGPRVHPVSPWLGAGLLCVSFRDTSPKLREVARDARYALHTAQPWEDHAGEYGEFMVRGWLEQIPSSHPAVTARPGQTPYGLVHRVLDRGGGGDGVLGRRDAGLPTVEAVLRRRARLSRRRRRCRGEPRECRHDERIVPEPGAPRLSEGDRTSRREIGRSDASICRDQRGYKHGERRV